VSGALQGTLYAFVLVSAPSLRMLWRLRESLLALPPLVSVVDKNTLRRRPPRPWTLAT
jgi:hypothetical protein